MYVCMYVYLYTVHTRTYRRHQIHPDYLWTQARMQTLLQSNSDVSRLVTDACLGVYAYAFMYVCM